LALFFILERGVQKNVTVIHRLFVARAFLDDGPRRLLAFRRAAMFAGFADGSPDDHHSPFVNSAMSVMIAWIAEVFHLDSYPVIDVLEIAILPGDKED